MIWRGDTKVGSSVSYKCIEGFHNVREGDTSVCNSEGIWSLPDILCQGIFLHFFSFWHFLSLLCKWVILMKLCHFSSILIQFTFLKSFFSYETLSSINCKAALLKIIVIIQLQSVKFFFLCFMHFHQKCKFCQIRGFRASSCDLKKKNHNNLNLLKMYSPVGYPRCRWVSFFIWTDMWKM